MHECGLTCLPDDLDELNNLERLGLSYNRLSHLCDGIGQLVKLKWINLANNKLECLPKEFCNLPSDATVHLHNNPLSVPPLSVCESGMSSIKSYFQSLEGSSAVNRTRRTKLIILGKSGSGKSSLIRAIQYSLEGREQNACVQREDRTIGIDQHVVSLSDVDLVILDSGGQRSYSPINQLFTSNSCLVIITADAQQYTVKADGAFKHLIQPYFQRVYDYVNTAVILPVVTKADLVPSEQFEQISTDLVHKGMEFQKEREKLMETYRQQNPGMMTDRQKITIIAKVSKHARQTQQRYEERCIKRVFFTSAKTGLGTPDLIKYINSLLQDRSLFPGLDSLLPSSWVESEDQLQSLGKRHSPPICSQTAAFEAIIPCGISPDNVQGLFSYLHTVGSICHYDQHPSLRNHVFLNPQFLIDLLKALYHHNLKSILTVDSLPLPERHLVTQRELESMLNNLSKNGIASIKLLRLIWAKFGFEEEHDNLMIKLLVSFNFAYIKCENDKSH
jgi:GTPase SAR1 family protein